MTNKLGGLGGFLCTKASWRTFLRSLEMDACHAKASWRSWKLVMYEGVLECFFKMS